MSDIDFLRRRVREYVRRGLGQACGPIAPGEYGPSIRSSLTTEEQDELRAFGDALIDDLFARETREQTRGGEATIEQVEAFPMDAWIGAAESGKRVQYRHAKWDDHRAHRENQIQNMRRVNRSFEVEEQRRDRLAAAGMADDPTMTTEDALARMEDEAA